MTEKIEIEWQLLYFVYSFIEDASMQSNLQVLLFENVLWYLQV